jgi:hypothetical protein
MRVSSNSVTIIPRRAARAATAAGAWGAVEPSPIRIAASETINGPTRLSLPRCHEVCVSKIAAYLQNLVKQRIGTAIVWLPETYCIRLLTAVSFSENDLIFVAVRKLVGICHLRIQCV